MPAYRSFVIRHWQLRPDKERIMIEQIQTGQTYQSATLAETIDWLQQQLLAAPEESARQASPGPASEPPSG